MTWRQLMVANHFVVGDKYSRNDVYVILNVPLERRRGNWETGYNKYENDWYIFCNINTPGRTGHNYQNRFINNDLEWYAKAHSRYNIPSIQSMINPVGNIHIFTRDNSSNTLFTYRGNARVKKCFEGTTPVKILWSFRSENLPDEIADDVAAKCKEGATKLVFVNRYERNPVARQRCIDYYGVKCSVCEFDFESVYGDIGRGFIHVHHLKQLAEIQGEYDVDPIIDLRPVCPNCHAILHRRNPNYSIEELQKLLHSKSG